MTDTKVIENFIIERRKRITHHLIVFLPSDISKLISEYDYELEGTAYTLTGHTDEIFCLALLPDGRIVSGADDNTIKIWNSYTGICDITFTTETYVRYIDILHDGRIVAAMGQGTITIWNPNT